MSLELEPLETLEEAARVNEKKEPKQTPKRQVKEIALPMSGRYYKARIVDIEEGTFGDFVDVERLIEALKARDPNADVDRIAAQADDPAYKVTFLVEELGVRDSEVFRVSFNAKSKFYRLLTLYGRPDEERGVYKLEVGDYVVVKSTVDDRTGTVRFRIVLDDVNAVRRILS